MIGHIVRLTFGEMMRVRDAAGFRETVAHIRQYRDRFTEDPPFRVHERGASAELAWAKYIDRHWDGCLLRSDGGAPDVCGWHIRYAKRIDGPLIIRDPDVVPEPFVLFTGDMPDLTIRGWYPASEVVRHPNWRVIEQDRPPCYKVPPSALFDLDDTRLRLDPTRFARQVMTLYTMGRA